MDGSADLLEKAETNFKTAWSVAKLLRPDEQHVKIVTGLSEALYGLGRVAEAKDVLRIAGLARKTMQEAMPGSYQRWIKPRVAKYMDKKLDADDEEAHPDAVRPTVRGDGNTAARRQSELQAESNRRDDAINREARKDAAASGDTFGPGPSVAAGERSSAPIDGPFRVRRAPAIEAAARAASHQQVRLLAGYVPSGVAGGRVERDGGGQRKDGHSPFSKFINKRVSKFFESRRQQQQQTRQ